MNFDRLPAYTTPIVELRPIHESDLLSWSDYLNRPEVYEHTSWNFPSVRELSSYLNNEACQNPDSVLRLAIGDPTSGDLLGTIGFHSVNPHNRVAELAFDLSPPHWGRGLIASVAPVLIDWAHSEAGIIRIQATVMDSNTRSTAAIKRLGFECEGLLRSFRIARGVPRDFHMFSHIQLPMSAT